MTHFCAQCGKAISGTLDWKLWNSYQPKRADRKLFCGNVCSFAFTLDERMKQPFYVMFCGSRDIPSLLTAETIINKELNAIASSVIIIHGGASGIDMLVDQLARMKGRKIEVFRPDYARHGKSAPIKRNIGMLRQASV